MNDRPPLTAILWDFDGTLADTRHKNLSVNRRIVEELSGRPWPEFTALGTIEAYDEAVRRAVNWRELYRANFGFTDDDCDRAAAVWASYQLQDRTPAPLFEGLPEVVRELADLPQGIVSQNARDHIIEWLAAARLKRHFGSIVGYQEVPLGRQKPHPDGLLVGLEELIGLAPGRALYIGDHEGDTGSTSRCCPLRQRSPTAATRSAGGAGRTTRPRGPPTSPPSSAGFVSCDARRLAQRRTRVYCTENVIVTM
jgi:beta-phosphoglucomutase-like phosphatase (HAD superfamily)